MEQIKKLLAPVKKYGFWASCGVILLASTAMWYKASSGLENEAESNLSAINAKYQAAQSIASKQKHPNEHSNKEMDALIERTLQSVVEAWDKQYSFQETILRWPRDLEDDFISAVTPLKPIEAHIDYPTPLDQELKVDFRHRYANYVDNLLPRLATLVGSTWLSKRDSAMTSGAPVGSADNQPQVLVQWNSSDQARLLATHFDWSKQPDSAPTTLQILYAQEDLWVLTALMSIIRQTNGDIDSRHEAVVKTIDSVMIGRAAIGRSGRIIRLQGGAASGMGTETGGADMYTGGATEMYDTSSETGMPGTQRAIPDPAEGRYVDNEYTPIAADTLRTALRSPTSNDAFLVVAKRMPIRLKLVVNQRKLHRLLAECGNSLLPVEVRQVRLNRTKSSPATQFGGGDMYGGGGAEMYGGAGADMYAGGETGLPGDESGLTGAADAYSGGESMYGGGMYGGGMYGGGMYGGSGASTADMKDRQVVSSTSNYDVPVELYGLIYIYNPVDREKLGIAEEVAQEAASAEAEVAEGTANEPPAG